MQRQLVDFKNVTIQIDSQKYFNDVNISIKKGEFVFLIGKTGSGTVPSFSTRRELKCAPKDELKKAYSHYDLQI